MPDAISPAQPRRAELAGGTVLWLFVAIELLTFGMFFVTFAVGWRGDPASFAAGRAQLHPLLGTINTCVLLTGGLLAARGVLANRRSDAKRTSRQAAWSSWRSSSSSMARCSAPESRSRAATSGSTTCS